MKFYTAGIVLQIRSVILNSFDKLYSHLFNTFLNNNCFFKNTKRIDGKTGNEAYLYKPLNFFWLGEQYPKTFTESSLKPCISV